MHGCTSKPNHKYHINQCSSSAPLPYNFKSPNLYFFSGVDVSIQFTHHFSNIRIEVEEEEEAKNSCTMEESENEKKNPIRE